MAVNWSMAPEVQELAGRLIGRDHPHLAGNGVQIRYLFRDDIPTSGGQEVLGRVKKVASLEAFLAGGPDPDLEDPATEPFFVLWIPKHVWKAFAEDERGRMGLVDSLLCRLSAGKDEEGNVKLSLNRPDHEVFEANIERYAFWWQGAQGLLTAMRKAGQMSLELEDEPRAAVTITGVGELGDDQPLSVPEQYRGACMGDYGVHEWDVRVYERCPICVKAMVDAETRPHEAGTVTDAQPELQVVDGGAEHANGNGTHGTGRRRGKGRLAQWQEGQQDPEHEAEAVAAG